MKMFTIKETSEILGITEHVTRGLVNSGRLVCYRYNQRLYRVPKAEIEAFLARCKTSQDTELAKLILEEEATA